MVANAHRTISTLRRWLASSDQPGLAETLCVAGLVLTIFLIGWATTASRGPWGDEEHYLQTVRLFGDGVSKQLLTSYEEMTTPLTFIAYAQWGRLVGFDTARLRLLSPLLATAACVLLWLVLAPGAKNRLHAAIALSVMALNPYFLGLGIFVFTDMLAIVMMAIVLLGYVKKSAVLVAVGIAGSVLTRQYFAFLVPALIASSLLDRRLSRTRRFSLLSAALIGLSALTPLYYLWGNHLSPTNSLRAVYTNEGIAYNFHALSLYLSAPAAYSLPTLVLAIISNRPRRVSIAAGIVTAGFVLVFPVGASAVQIAEGSLTVGFLTD